MPVWMRRYHISKINEYNLKQEEEVKKLRGESSPPSNKPTGPNISPSSTYNF